MRTDQPSDLGGWSYDIADTKLARRLKVPALLQMATYAEQQAVETGADTDPAPVPHCSQCRWSAHCTTRWEQADDLSLVAGMRSGHRHALIAAGLPTVEALA